MLFPVCPSSLQTTLRLPQVTERGPCAGHGHCFRASEMSRGLSKGEERFAKLALSTGDPRRHQRRPRRRETKPPHGMDVLSGCCVASPPSLVLPFPEGAGPHKGKAQVMAHQSQKIPSTERKGNLLGKPEESRFPSSPYTYITFFMQEEGVRAGL